MDFSVLFEQLSWKPHAHGIAVSQDVFESLTSLATVPDEKIALPPGAAGLFAGLPVVVDPALPPGKADIAVTRQAWVKRLADIAALPHPIRPNRLP